MNSEGILRSNLLLSLSLLLLSRRLGALSLTLPSSPTASTALFVSGVSFSSPLLDQGYPDTVQEYLDGTLEKKPLLIYLPGFDGTLVAPFLQFPELSTEFDVWGMEVSMDDRSSVTELCNAVLQFVDDKLKGGDGDFEAEDETDDDSDSGSGSDARAEAKSVGCGRPLYIAGESFGGILALEVALAIEQRNKANTTIGEINLSGLTLINPATCFDTSKLAKFGPPIANGSPFLYPFNLMTIVPLFNDEYALPQLIKILQAEALPSIIDTPAREAYMGRSAFSLPTKLKFMPQSTLKWRLEEWLTEGCKAVRSKLNTNEVQDSIKNTPILIVVGEKDETLPSVEESKRLKSILAHEAEVHIHIVKGAGHACTSGSRVDLTALMRKTFGLSSSTGRTAMKEAAQNDGVDLGLEPRYDGASIGLSPTKYWSKGLFQRVISY